MRSLCLHQNNLFMLFLCIYFITWEIKLSAENTRVRLTECVLFWNSSDWLSVRASFIVLKCVLS